LREQSGRPEIDEERLRACVRVAVHFLDDVIEVNKLPVPEIERMVRGNRKIGLGVMGFAELLIRLGIPYDSDEAVQIAEEVMNLIDDEARKASQELAEERGVFPYWRGSVYEAQNVKVRNATRRRSRPRGRSASSPGRAPASSPCSPWPTSGRACSAVRRSTRSTRSSWNTLRVTA
jgi:ribonucleoside-diphosphate reductase alpha chain